MSTHSSLVHSSSLYHASLVHPSSHSPILLRLVQLKLSRSIVEYIVDSVVDTVDYAMGRPSSTSARLLSCRPEHAKFFAFAHNVIKRAEVSTPTLLATLVYIDRAKPHLHIALEEWALERVFLGALIVASKYLNDSTLKNIHWALCTGVFGKRDVGRIEREFLDVLDFQLGITEDDLLAHHDGLSAVALSSHSPRASRGFSHPHHTHRSLARHPQPVPELDPSSPESSSPGSDSPRTPSTLESSPPYPPTHKGTQPQHSSRTLELLRSFPIIPIPTSSHQSHDHGRFSSSKDTHVQRPIDLQA